MRAANDKLARGVHQIARCNRKETAHFGIVQLLQHARHKNIYHILANLLLHPSVCLLLVAATLVSRDKLIMLRAHYDCVHSFRTTFVAILHRHLALRVGSQISHLVAFLANGGQRLHDALGQVKRQRHIVFRFIGSIAEHHALVAGALRLFRFTAHTAVNVLALLVHGIEHTATFSIKTILRFRVTDTTDGLSRYQGNVNVSIGTHLTGHYHLASCHQRFASHMRLRVVSQQFVKHSITDLVSHLVGMTFRYRFRSK